jgi:hypothetical protein
VGVFHVVESQEQLIELLNIEKDVDKNLRKTKKILVMSPAYFNYSIIEELIETEFVAGILVLDDIPNINETEAFKRPDFLSPERKIPNQIYDIQADSTFEWNPNVNTTTPHYILASNHRSIRVIVYYMLILTYQYLHFHIQNLLKS